MDDPRGIPGLVNSSGDSSDKELISEYSSEASIEEEEKQPKLGNLTDGSSEEEEPPMLEEPQKSGPLGGFSFTSPAVKNPEELREAGNDLFRRDNLKGALAKYQEVLSLCNGLDRTAWECLAKTYSNIATCLNKLDNFEGAIQMAFWSLEKKPDFPKPYLHLSKSFSGLGNPAMARLCLLKGKTLTAADPSTFSSALRKLDSPEHVVARVSSYIHKVAEGRAWQVDAQKAAEEEFGEVSFHYDSEDHVPCLDSSTNDSEDIEQEMKKSMKSGAANRSRGLAPRDLPGLLPDGKASCSGSTSGVSGSSQAQEGNKEESNCSERPAWQSRLRGFFDKKITAEAAKGKKSKDNVGMQKEAENREHEFQDLFQKEAKRRQKNAETAEKIKHKQMKTNNSKKKEKLCPPLSNDSEDMEQEVKKSKKNGAAIKPRGLAPSDLPGLVSGVRASCSDSASRLSGKPIETENREQVLQKEANRTQENAKVAEEKRHQQMKTDKRKKSDEILQRQMKELKDSEEKQRKLNDIKMKSQEQVSKKKKVLSTGNCSVGTVKKDASPLASCRGLVEEGCLAFQNGFMATAVDRFNPALDIHRKNLQGTPLVTLNYVFARSCIETRSLVNLRLAKKTLENILAESSFPAVFLGFALLYGKLNRFTQALAWAVKGRNYLDSGLPCPAAFLPGCEGELLQETRADPLRAALTNILEQPSCPHTPKAVCRYLECLSVQRELRILPSTSIFLSEPDFKQFFQICCHRGCRPAFHSYCWDQHRSSCKGMLGGRNPSNRDFLGIQCLTPDCGGTITSILITDQTAAVKKIENDKVSARVESEEKKARKLLKKLKAEKEEEVKRAKHEEAVRKVNIKNRKNHQVAIIPEADAAVLPKIMLPEVVFACNSKLLNKRGNQLGGKETRTAVKLTAQGNAQVHPNKNECLEKNGLSESLKSILVCRLCGREEEDFVTCGSCGGELEKRLAGIVDACNITEQCHSEGTRKELQVQEQNVEERSKLAQLARNIRSQLKLQENGERGGFNRKTEEVLLLRQNNWALNQELKVAKDRLERQQDEYTNQKQDLSVQESEGWTENREIIEAVSEATDKVKKMETLCREGLKKDEELARMKSSLSVKCQVLEECNREVEEVTMRMSLEQEQSRQLKNELEKEERERKEEVCQLEIRILMDQYRRLDSDLEQRKRENEHRIQHLHSLIGQGHKDSRLVAANQLAQYAVELQQAQVSLSNQFQEMIGQGPNQLTKCLSLAPAVPEPPLLPHQEEMMLRFLSTLGLPVSQCPSSRAPFPPSPSSPGLLAAALPSPLCSKSTGLLAQDVPASQGSWSSPSLLDSSTGTRTQTAVPGGSDFPGFGAGLAARTLAGTGAVPRRKAEAAAVQEGGANKKSSLSHLVEKLCSTLPGLSPSEARRYIMLFKEQSGGKLTNVRLDHIELGVRDIIIRDWSSAQEGQDYTQEEECPVCLDEMTEVDSRRLRPCGHRFHKKCFNDWVQSARGPANTCPMCRDTVARDSLEDPGRASQAQ